jgi:type I restriction enzyme S subunit
MAGEWKTLPLQDCMAAIIDYRGKTPDKKTFGIPLVTAKVIKGGRIERPDEFIAEADFDAWMRRGMPESGDIVMTTEAPLGEIAQLDGKKVALAQRVITLRGKPDLLDNTFLKFLLQSHSVQEELQSRATGTTVLGIRQSELRKVNLTLPPFPEQRAIAHVLGTLDDMIELNRETNEILEEMARALFKSWFVDFDPVRAKLEGRPPAGMDAATAALFPDHFQDSELGQIPMGWEVVTVGDLATLKGGTQLEKESFFDHGTIPIFGGAGVMGHGELYNADGFVISVGRVGAYCGQYFYHRGKAWINNNASLIRQREEISGEWLLLCLRNINMEVIKKGAAQPFVSNSDIAAVKVLLPSHSILDRFQDMIRPVFLTIESNQTESRDLANLRDTLLPKLLSGEISAPAAEELIAAST